MQWFMRPSGMINRLPGRALFAAGLAISMWLSPRVRGAAWIEEWKRQNPVWRGVHVMLRDEKRAAQLESALPALVAAGVNTVVAEIDYNYAFKKRPEFREKNVLSKEDASRLAEACHRVGVRLIPQFNCLGHQSWAGQTFPLLARRPDFDETPDEYPDNKGIYCRSWCPQNPEVNKVAFDLMDDIADGFQADAMHVGMDEVFILASNYCPRCRGGDPAKLFSKAVNDLHGHLVRRRRLEMFMWADRFLDSKTLGFGEWEAAKNGTSRAIDKIPRDIVLCDWHYETLEKYEGKPVAYSSVPYLAGKGFRVWPTGWRNTEAAGAFSRSARSLNDKRVLGYLCSTWDNVKTPDLAVWPPLEAGFAPWR